MIHEKLRLDMNFNHFIVEAKKSVDVRYSSWILSSKGCIIISVMEMSGRESEPGDNSTMQTIESLIEEGKYNDALKIAIELLTHDPSNQFAADKIHLLKYVIKMLEEIDKKLDINDYEGAKRLLKILSSEVPNGKGKDRLSIKLGEIEKNWKPEVRILQRKLETSEDLSEKSMILHRLIEITPPKDAKKFRKIKQDLIKKEETIKQKLSQLLTHVMAFVFMIVGVFYSVNSPIIQQSNNDFLLPIKWLFRPKIEEKSIKEFNESLEKEAAKKTYIFVLDPGKSTEWNGPIPDWYNSTIAKLITRISNDFEYLIGDERSFNICKVKLFQFLLEIESQKANFAVWKLDDEAKKIYPEKVGKMEIETSSENIIEAITIINRIKNNVEGNKNFTNLFTRILSNYDLHKKEKSIDGIPVFSLIMVSDLIHNGENIIRNKLIGKPGYGEREIENRIKIDKNQLEDCLKELSKADLLVNIVVIKEAVNAENKEKNETSILGYLNGKIWNRRLKVISISESNNKLLFSDIKGGEGINFYHGDGPYITESSSIIKLDQYGTYHIGLFSPTNSASLKDVKIEIRILDSNNNERKDLRYRENLFVNGEICELSKLEAFEKIKFIYTGPVPAQDERLELHIYMPLQERRTNCIPIYFKKDMHASNVTVLLLCYFYVILYFLSYFVFIIIHFLRSVNAKPMKRKLKKKTKSRNLPESEQGEKMDEHFDIMSKGVEQNE